MNLLKKTFRKQVNKLKNTGKYKLDTISQIKLLTDKIYFSMFLFPLNSLLFH